MASTRGPYVRHVRMLLKVVRVITGSRFRAGLVVASVVVAGGVALSASPASAAQVCTSGVAEDINGDGFADAAIGEPGGGGGTSVLGGEVHVLYGTAAGLALGAVGQVPDDQVIVAGVGGVPGTNTEGDSWGDETLLADFNGDGCADLAMGSTLTGNGAGAVTVLYGSPTGISTALGTTFITEDSALGAGNGAENESLGGEFAAGDFNGDGFVDLAMGVPGEKVAAAGVDRGGVLVAPGSATGLGAATLITQETAGVPTPAEDGDLFGIAVAAGDANNDGTDDLAVGVSGENGKGVVQMLPGGATGLGGTAATTFSQNTAGVPGTAEIGDFFGDAVAMGDVTGDGRDDLVVGVPGENTFAGAVAFLRGSATGITGTGAQGWSQNTAGVAGVAGADDNFGFTVAVGKVNNNATLDVAVGVPGDDVGSVVGAGSVTVLRGTSTGLTATGSVRYTQNTTGVAGAAEALDGVGFAVNFARLQGAATDNLLIGTPFEVIAGIADTGLVHQLATTGSNLTGTGSVTISLSTPGLNGASSHTGALFGWAVG